MLFTKPMPILNYNVVYNKHSNPEIRFFTKEEANNVFLVQITDELYKPVFIKDKYYNLMNSKIKIAKNKGLRIKGVALGTEVYINVMAYLGKSFPMFNDAEMMVNSDISIFHSDSIEKDQVVVLTSLVPSSIF